MGISCASLAAISHTFHSLFKVLFNFPSRYLFAIGTARIFRLWIGLPPTSECTFKHPNSGTHHVTSCITYHGPFTLYRFEFHDVKYAVHWGIVATSHCLKGFNHGHFSLHSPLLWKSFVVSFPSLSDMLKFREKFCITQTLFHLSQPVLQPSKWFDCPKYRCKRNIKLQHQTDIMLSYVDCLLVFYAESYTPALRRVMVQFAFEELMQIFTIHKTITHVESFFLNVLSKWSHATSCSDATEHHRI